MPGGGPVDRDREKHPPTENSGGPSAGKQRKAVALHWTRGGMHLATGNNRTRRRRGPVEELESALDLEGLGTQVLEAVLGFEGRGTQVSHRRTS